MGKVKVYIPTELRRVPGAVERAVENSLTNRAEDIRIDFLVTAQTWRNKPEFRIKKRYMGRLIYTESPIYGYVSLGTRPHIIKAVKAPALRFFRTGFKPKTRRRVIASYAGAVANKDLTTVYPPKVVHHPGNEPREFQKEIAYKWRKQFPKLLQQAINAEVSRVTPGHPVQG